MLRVRTSAHGRVHDNHRTANEGLHFVDTTDSIDCAKYLLYASHATVTVQRPVATVAVHSALYGSSIHIHVFNIEIAYTTLEMIIILLALGASGVRNHGEPRLQTLLHPHGAKGIHLPDVGRRQSV